MYVYGLLKRSRQWPTAHLAHWNQVAPGFQLEAKTSKRATVLQDDRTAPETS